MLIVEPEVVPPLEQLEPNTTAGECREYLAGAIGIEENLHTPSIGQTRAALAANFVHSLYYCFQGQGEIANPEVLFHRQNRDWQAQTIRDTLPYFLGAQGLDELRRRQRLAEQRRLLRQAQQRLARAQSETFEEVDRARGLLIEAGDVGLVGTEEIDRVGDQSVQESRVLLQSLVDRTLEPAPIDDGGTGFETIRLELADQRERAREILEQLQGLENFSEVAASYSTELSEQHARLQSIGLIPEGVHEAQCPLCGSSMGTDPDAQHELLTAELEAVSRRLELAGRDRPRIERARSDLLEEREGVLGRISELNATLSALATTNDLVARERQRVNVQSYLKGKISEYLSSVVDLSSEELEAQRAEVLRLETAVRELEVSLDPELVRSRVESSIARISRDITAIAAHLGLGYSESGVRLDANRLTVVADTPAGPAYLDAGQIGSGLNWVGYHLAVYLSLQRYFIEQDRPVPRFVLIDQPSQAFFPPDRQTGGDLEELSDTDREHTKDLYQLMFDEVQARQGSLQLIVLDHADFEDQWFQDAVVQRWRDGEALIPSSWYDEVIESPPSDS
jgi:hypothetical protein